MEHINLKKQIQDSRLHTHTPTTNVEDQYRQSTLDVAAVEVADRMEVEALVSPVLCDVELNWSDRYDY